MSQDTLECPVCYEALWTPIFQCFNGHLVCEFCISQVLKCPVCREELPKRKIRNLEIEKVVSSRPFSCPFEKEGCQDTKRHVGLDCPFASLHFCPHFGFKNCQELFPRRDILTHLTQGHGVLVDESFTSLGETVNVCQSVSRLQDLDRGAKLSWSPVAFGTREGQLFFLRTRALQRRIRWDVFVLGSKGVASELSARIRLHREASDRKGVYLEWGGSVKELRQEEESADPVSFLRTFSFEVEELKKLVSSSGGSVAGRESKWLLKVTVVNKNEEPQTEMELSSARPCLNNPAVLEVEEEVPVVRPAGENAAGIMGSENRNGTGTNVPLNAPLINNGNMTLGMGMVNGLTNNSSELPAAAQNNVSSLIGIMGNGMSVGFPNPPLVDLARVGNSKLGASYMTSIVEERRNSVHELVRCSSCSVLPILGRRYKCVECLDYDLCSECIRAGRHEHPHKLFLMSFSDREKPQLLASFQSILSNLPRMDFLVELGRVNFGNTCEGCRNMNTSFSSVLIGPRHKCVICPSYDLCLTCISSVGHNHALFLVALHPVIPQKMEAAIRYAREAEITGAMHSMSLM